MVTLVGQSSSATWRPLVKKTCQKAADGESIRGTNGHRKTLFAHKGMHSLRADKGDKKAMIFEDAAKAE